MITRFGMTSDFDMVALETVNNAYLSGDTSLACAPETAARIDEAVFSVVKEAHQKARTILETHRQKLDELAQYLLKKETITGDEFHGHPERNGPSLCCSRTSSQQPPRRGVKNKLALPCKGRGFFLKRRLLTNGDKCDIISELPYGKPRESSD